MVTPPIVRVAFGTSFMLSACAFLGSSFSFFDAFFGFYSSSEDSELELSDESESSLELDSFFFFFFFFLSFFFFGSSFLVSGFAGVVPLLLS